jgi:hypothetical protein
MTKAKLTTTLGTLLSLGLALASQRYPQYSAAFVPLATLLFGWLHLPAPQQISALNAPKQ